MINGAKITGVETVTANLRKEILQIKGRSMAGLIKSGIIIRRDMEKTQPLTPVDTGNLRASWVTGSFNTIKGPSHTIGYSANYALWVHENTGAQFSGRKPTKRKGKKSVFPGGRPGSGALWFQKAIERNYAKILQTIRDNAKVE